MVQVAVRRIEAQGRVVVLVGQLEVFWFPVQVHVTTVEVDYRVIRVKLNCPIKVNLGQL